MKDIELWHGDCLELMKDIPDGSVDMILCDLPYGVTKNKWDSVIPFDPLWKEYLRVSKEKSAIVLFGQGMFTCKLMLSNEGDWRYNLIWDKVLSSGFLNANRMPLRSHEDICVFYRRLPNYNPQYTQGKPCHSKGTLKGSDINNNYGSHTLVENKSTTNKHPLSIKRTRKPHPSKSLHPTEKPVDLLSWLIKSYTNEGETILDNCMGSGSTGIACLDTNRRFIGIEKDDKYFQIAKKRMEDHQKQLRMF